MFETLVRTLGRQTIERTRSVVQTGYILAKAVMAALRLDRMNAAIVMVTVRQIYFTAVQPMRVIVIAALAIGCITVDKVVGILTSLGAYNQVGFFLVSSMLHEIAPITVALILLLRSSAAVVSEVSLMKINGELDTLHMLGIDITEYLFLPRIIAFTIAGPSLAFFFSLVGLIGGFMIIGYLHDITFGNYMDQLSYATSVKDLVVLMVKPALLGFVIAGSSIQKGMSVNKAFTEVPIKLIHSMMQSMVFIVVIEIMFGLLGV